MGGKKPKKYMRPMTLKLPCPLHDRMKRYVEAKNGPHDPFYAVERFIRESIEEKLQREGGERVERFG